MGGEASTSRTCKLTPCSFNPLPAQASGEASALAAMVWWVTVFQPTPRLGERGGPLRRCSPPRPDSFQPTPRPRGRGGDHQQDLQIKTLQFQPTPDPRRRRGQPSIQRTAALDVVSTRSPPRARSAEPSWPGFNPLPAHVSGEAIGGVSNYKELNSFQPTPRPRERGGVCIGVTSALLFLFQPTPRPRKRGGTYGQGKADKAVEFQPTPRPDGRGGPTQSFTTGPSTGFNTLPGDA